MTMPVSQTKRRALYRTLMLTAFTVMIALTLAARLFDVPVHLPMAGAVLFIGVLSFLQFNALDEVAKQAHYVAWYWGGLIALGAVAVLTMALSLSPPLFAAIEQLMLRWFGNAEARTSFMLGLMTAPVLLALGFAAWWGVYWLRRR